MIGQGEGGIESGEAADGAGGNVGDFGARGREERYLGNPRGIEAFDDAVGIHVGDDSRIGHGGVIEAGVERDDHARDQR